MSRQIDNEIDAQDQYGKTLLHQAAIRGFKYSVEPNLIQSILKQQPTLHIKDKEGNTALHTAAWAAQNTTNLQTAYQILDYAIQSRFDFSTQNNEGYSVLHVAALTYQEQPLTLHIALATLKAGLPLNLSAQDRTGLTVLGALLRKDKIQEATAYCNLGLDLSKENKHTLDGINHMIHHLTIERDSVVKSLNTHNANQHPHLITRLNRLQKDLCQYKLLQKKIQTALAQPNQTDKTTQHNPDVRFQRLPTGRTLH